MEQFFTNSWYVTRMCLGTNAQWFRHWPKMKRMKYTTVAQFSVLRSSSLDIEWYKFQYHDVNNLFKLLLGVTDVYGSCSVFWGNILHSFWVFRISSRKTYSYSRNRSDSTTSIWQSKSESLILSKVIEVFSAELLFDLENVWQSYEKTYLDRKVLQVHMYVWEALFINVKKSLSKYY